MYNFSIGIIIDSFPTDTKEAILNAAKLGKKALCLLTISDHIYTGEALSAEDRQNTFHEMMEVALELA